MGSTQQYPSDYLAADRSRELLNVAVTFAVLETVFVVLYLMSRVMNKTANGWDVYLMIPGYIFCFGCIIVAIRMSQFYRQRMEPYSVFRISAS